MADWIASKNGTSSLQLYELESFTIQLNALNRYYSGVLEETANELRYKIECRAAQVDDVIQHYATHIAALLATCPHAHESFIDVFDMMPEEFQNTVTDKHLNEKLEELHEIMRDLNELCRQRARLLSPCIYEDYSELARNPPIWMNPQHMFIGTEEIMEL